MKRKWLFSLLLLVLALALLGVASASALTTYGLAWWTVDGGGARASNGSYSLDGTLGQPDAGVSSGGRYTLSGGFWPGAQLPSLFLPLVKR